MLHLYLHTYSLRFHFAHASNFNVFSFINRAAADGFAGVAISANGPGYRHLGGTDPEHFRRVRNQIQNHGLLCDLDTSGTDPTHLNTLLEVARAVGAQQIRTYTRHRGIPPEEMVVRTTKDLIAIAPRAEAAGVHILLENHEEFTGTQIATILTRVNSPWIAALYDYGNSQMLLEDPYDALEAMAPHARSAHLKDHVLLAPEDAPDGQLSVLGVPIGQGNLPIVDLTRRLLDTGLNHIVFENVWAYRAPVTLAQNAGQEPGHGLFAFARPPFKDSRCLLDPNTLAAQNPTRLIALEEQALQDGLTWLRHAFKKAHIPLPPTP
ncbi:MAG: TIM barrel protein [bacterium]|nr:TIM barrel protein [bacterium]